MGEQALGETLIAWDRTRTYMYTPLHTHTHSPSLTHTHKHSHSHALAQTLADMSIARYNERAKLSVHDKQKLRAEGN